MVRSIYELDTLIDTEGADATSFQFQILSFTLIYSLHPNTNTVALIKEKSSMKRSLIIVTFPHAYFR